MKRNKWIIPAIIVGCITLGAAKCNKPGATSATSTPPAMNTEKSEKKFSDWVGNWTDEQAKMFFDGKEQTGRVTMNITKPSEEGWMLSFEMTVQATAGEFKGHGLFGFDEAANKIHFRFTGGDNPEAEEQEGTWVNNYTFKVHHETTQDGKPYIEDNIWSKSERDKWSLKYADQLAGEKQFGMDVTFRRVE